MLDGDPPQPLRGAAARIVENMEASLGVPTATSVRSVPAKLLEVNRQILNNHLARTRGGKVSFTHLIGYAVLQALRSVPNMNSSFGVVDGKPSVVRHTHVNLGLAIDLQKDDGSRTLLVPNIKSADTLDFAAFHAAYEEIIRKARTNKLAVDDFTGTTVSITNPGTIGTMHSVPRLMPGQGAIVGVGSITYPIEFEGADPQTLAEIGISKIVTLTSTYDHRVIQGAESGEFLGRIHELLLGEHDFYSDLFASFGVPYEPARWGRDHKPVEGSIEAVEKALAVKGLINMYRVRGHLIANLDPLGLKEPRTHEELDPINWGLTIWDLDRDFPTGGVAGKRVMRLRDILGVLRDAYSRTIGVEYMHIQEPDEKAWIQRQFEGVHVEPTADEKLEILASLNAAEAFERFLHTKYLGQKRFSLEGSETLIPMLQFLLDEAADAGMEEVVMGMSHRGRLNVLANVVGKSYGQIFREFEGELDPNVPQGSGDVKYHVGATGKHTAPSGKTANLTLAANPSHLEAVDPVVEGMVRAKQDRAGDRGPREGAVGAHPRRRRVRGSGRGRRDAEPVGASRLRRRRHRARRRQQPGRIHDAARVRPLDRVRHRHRQGGAGADLPRQRRRPGSVGARDPPRVRVPAGVQEGRRRRHGLLPAVRPQRRRRARVHAAAHVRGDRPPPIGAQALHRDAREPRRPDARAVRARARRLSFPPRRRVRRDAGAGTGARRLVRARRRARAAERRDRRAARTARHHRERARRPSRRTSPCTRSSNAS